MIEEIIQSYLPVVTAIIGIVIAVKTFLKELTTFISNIKDMFGTFGKKLESNTETQTQIKALMQENAELKKEIKTLIKEITRVDKG